MDSPVGNTAPVMAEVWRGGFLESFHTGHAVIANAKGEIVEAWGDPDLVVLPRSSAKMIQALPLLESGAAKAAGLEDRHLALACASHQGAAIHTDLVQEWLKEIGRNDADFRCGPQEPSDREARDGLIRAGESPCQMHNNCSGKHTGFLTLTRHLKADGEYIAPDHPVQKAVKDAFEEVTGEVSPGFGIDGCSAPNHACSLAGMARAMAFFAAAPEDGSLREQSAHRLVRAMMTYPELVAGETRACTELMRAAKGRVALKTGAEAFFVAMIPEAGLGIALKISDGTTRASECAIAALLVRLGVLEKDHPATLKRMNAPIRNWRGIETGVLKPGAALIAP